MVKFTLAVLLLLGSSTNAIARLTWEQRTLEFAPAAKEDKVVAEYAFKNTSDHAITITSIKSSCGCTVAETDKKTYRPGEVGRLAATFTVGDRQGEHVKTITVITDDPADSKMLLTMKIRLPEILKIEPKYVYWKQGDPTSPKTVRILNLQEKPLKSIVSDVTQDRMRVTIREVVPGREFELVVVPSDTAVASVADLRLTVDLGESLARQFHAYAVVRPASALGVHSTSRPSQSEVAMRRKASAKREQSPDP